MSASELEFYANSILSNAKERNYPGVISSEDDLAPRQLCFGFGANDACYTQQDAFSAGYADADSSTAQCQFVNAEAYVDSDSSVNASSSMMKPSEGTNDAAHVDSDCTQKAYIDVDDKLAALAFAVTELPQCSTKVETPAFTAVTEIPSPTRNQAKKHWAAMKMEAQQKMMYEEEEEAQQKMAAISQEELVEQNMKESVDEEEEARLKEIEEVKMARKLEEKAEMEEMDRLCVATFLESVKNYAWRKKVYTPIKGTNLYTKHMRPCRPAGSSVDVKDSTFRNLGNFMQFLEYEGLLHLQPGLTDPVVTSINYNACRRYTYDPSRRLSSA